MTKLRTVAMLSVLLATVGVSNLAALDGRELLRKVDDLWRGKSSAAVMTMQIKTEHWERSLQMRAYSKGKDLSLVRIVLPKAEAGTATLKVDDNIWNYLPKTRRVMKIPSSMMMGSWMGSHFTNDDLVRDSRLEEDYEFEMSEREDAEQRPVYELVLLPKPDAPVVWGKIVLEIQKDTWIPNWQEYYDEDGTLVRKSTFTDVEDIGDRTVPMTMRIVPQDKPEEFTEIRYEQLKFDMELDDGFFSLQNLQRR